MSVEEMSERDRLNMGADFIGGFSITNEQGKVTTWVDFESTKRTYAPEWERVSTPFIPMFAGQSHRTAAEHSQAIADLRKHYESTPEPQNDQIVIDDDEVTLQAILQIISNVQKIAGSNGGNNPNPRKLIDRKTNRMKPDRFNPEKRAKS